jgi:hypothetical protein
MKSDIAFSAGKYVALPVFYSVRNAVIGFT